MIKLTIEIIEKLLNEDLDVRDISKIMSDSSITEALESGADYEISASVEDFGKDNSENELYEGDGDFYSFGKFLLSSPGAWNYLKLPSGKVFSVMV